MKSKTTTMIHKTYPTPDLLATAPLFVETKSHTYPIILSDDFVSQDDWRLHIVGRQVLIVSNETVSKLFLAKVQALLSDFEVVVCLLPDGEQHKTQASVDKIYDCLMTYRFGRDCTMIALGGGVIGDMVGFAAASFMRGVRFIQMPTTLLSQVDSSVGGKTGINHPLGKNMIGAFWQPVCVVADMGAIASLPDREFSAGMAEVIKYGLIMDAPFLDWLWDNRTKILAKDKAYLSAMVRQSCAYKADIVAQDETEQGCRAWLNFGHTFGHAIEGATGYGAWLHGEAVAVGMVQAMCLSYALGQVSERDVGQVIELLQAFGLPVVPPDCDSEILLDFMARDKKVQAGKLRFITLQSLGLATIDGNVPLDLVRAVLKLPYERMRQGDFGALQALRA